METTRYLREARVVARLLPDGGTIPNNPTLPLLLYRGAVSLPHSDPAALFEALFDSNGWPGSWRDGIFGFHHYHSTAHEVLGIFRGSATVQLGGEHGVTVTVEPGDVVIIPAGVGHKKLDSAGGLGVVGSYPAGQSPDMCRGDAPHEARRAQAVAAVPMPSSDPVYGRDGPLFAHWKGRACPAGG